MRAVYHNVNFLFKFTSFVLGSKLTIYGLDHFMAFLFVRVQAICLRLFVKALSIAQDFLRRIQISKVNNVWILRNCCINIIGLLRSIYYWISFISEYTIQEIWIRFICNWKWVVKWIIKMQKVPRAIFEL